LLTIIGKNSKAARWALKSHKKFGLRACSEEAETIEEVTNIFDPRRLFKNGRSRGRMATEFGIQNDVKSKPRDLEFGCCLRGFKKENRSKVKKDPSRDCDVLEWLFLSEENFSASPYQSQIDTRTSLRS